MDQDITALQLMKMAMISWSTMPRTYDGIKTKDPLYDPNRHAHLLKVQYDENGRPIFDYQKH